MKSVEMVFEIWPVKAYGMVKIFINLRKWFCHWQLKVYEVLVVETGKEKLWEWF